MPIEQIPPWLESLMTSDLALVVLFGICVLEGAMMLRFMPSELVVPAALFFIGSSIGVAATIVAIAVVGTTIGQFILFVLVRKGGREYVVERRWFPIGEDKLDRFDGWFERRGPVVVAVSNTMLFVRGLFTIPAGLSEMDPRKFVALSAVGSLSVQTILAGLYLLGGHLLLFN